MKQSVDRSYLNALIVAVAAVFLFWLLGNVFLLIFGGFLLSVLLRSLSDFISDRTPLSRMWGLGVVIGLMILFFAGFSLYFFPELSTQLSQLRTKIPEAFNQLRESLSQYAWAEGLIPQMDELTSKLDGETFQKVAGALSSTLGALLSGVVVLFIGIYLSIEPNSYKKGLLALIPKDRQDRVEEVMYETDSTLKWWLVGKLASMAIIAVSTAIGLALIDVPMAMLLGLIAGLLSFIPNIGPVLSALPAILLAFTVSPETVLYTVILYLGTQAVESYLITPFIQRRTILMPPVLILSAQLIFGVLFGFLGLLLATPITAVIIIFTKNFYVADYLGKNPENYSPES